MTSSANIGREAVGIPLLAATLVLLLALADRVGSARAVLWSCLAGLSNGALTVYSPALLGLGPLSAVWIVGAARDAGTSWRRSLGLAAAFAIASSVAIGGFHLYRANYPGSESFANAFFFGWAFTPPWDERLGQRLNFDLLMGLLRERPLEVLHAEIESVAPNADGLLFRSTFNRFDPVFLVGRTPFALTLEVYFLVAILCGMLISAFTRRLARPHAGLLALILIHLIVVNIVIFSSWQTFRYRAPYDLAFLFCASLGLWWVVGRASTAEQEARTIRQKVAWSGAPA